MAAPPRHVLLELDDDDDDRSIDSASSAAFGIESSATSFSARRDLRAPPPPFEPADDDGRGGFDDGEDPSDGDDSDDNSITLDQMREKARIRTTEDGGAGTTSSRFWGVCWDRKKQKWQAQYTGADGKPRYIGLFDDDEEAAHAYNKKVRDAGLQGKRHMNAVDATGALVPRVYGRDHSAVVAPDPERAPTETTSKFWGVNWHKQNRRWNAGYLGADGKRRYIGLFDTQEAAAHAVNAAIRRAGLEGRRKTNPVVDGQLVPKSSRKRSREDAPAAAPTRRSARRSRQE